MELKGKAKEGFEKWFVSSGEVELIDIHSVYYAYIGVYEFSQLSNSMQWGVYVDFFDSVGIEIEIKRFSNDKWHYILFYKGGSTKRTFIRKHLKNRHEARAKAVEKAVELFNSREK